MLADGIYGTHTNRRWLKDQGIAFGGKPLGRPPKRTADEQQTVDAQRRADARARIPIEGKFGQGRGAYGLARTAARRPETSQAWIRSIFLVMNLIALARLLFWLRFGWVCHALRRVLACRIDANVEARCFTHNSAVIRCQSASMGSVESVSF